MAINKIQTAGGTENILGNIGIKRNGSGYLIAGDLQSYNGNGIDNPFTINMDLATINGKSINQNEALSAGLMHLTSVDLYIAGNPTTIGKELYLAYLPFSTASNSSIIPVPYSLFSSLPYYFTGYPDYNKFGTGIAAGIINLGRTAAMTLEEGDVLFGFAYRYRVRNSAAVEFIGKWYVIDTIDVIWVEGAERPEMVNISGHCVNRSVNVTYPGGVTSDVTTPDETDTFNFSYSYIDFGEDEVDENVSLVFNSNYFKSFYGQRSDLPVVGRGTSSYYSSELSSSYLYVVTGKLSTPPVSGTDGFAPVQTCSMAILTIDKSGTPTPCYTENDSVQLYSENNEQVTESIGIGGKTIEIGYNRRTHSFNPNLPTLLKPLQSQLVSGTNIKTVNNQSLLGEGNITIEGGGQSYTAGDNITIENNVISAQVPEQRVLIDEDDDTGLHSGFVVKSPHWRNNSGDIDLGTWNRLFANNIPAEGADPYTQAGYLTSNRMTVTFKDLQYNDGESPTYAKETIYSYLEINGAVVASGESISFTSSESDHTIVSGDTLVMDSTTFAKLSSLIDQELANNYMSNETVVYLPSYTWVTENSAFIVHQGTETKIIDQTGLNSAMAQAVGNMYVQASTPSSRTSIGAYTNSHVLIFPDADITYPGATTISGKSAQQVNLPNKLTNPAKNLTVGFDTTYQEQATVTYYSYQYGPKPADFFGDGVYGGSWYGSTGSCMGKLGNEYYLDMGITQLADNLTYPKNLMVYTEGQSGQMELYLTIDNGALKVMTANGETGYDWNSNYIDLKTCVAFVVNGVKQTISSLPMTLAADYTTVTQLGIMPLSDGNNLVINNGVQIYVQTSNQPSYASVFENTLFPYETTGQVTKNYENAPDKLNHFIRYAGETGSAVANRKAYLLTDLNIAQAAYIQQLEARITALETRLNNYNGKGMQIEAQYPGSSMAG